MAGKKTFVAGEVLTAQDVNDYLMDQSVMNFESAGARGSAIPTPTEGMITYLSDDNQIESYDGDIWRVKGPFAIAAAQVNAVYTASSNSSATITFPANRFTQPPLVVLTNTGAAGALSGSTYRAASITAATFNLLGTATATITNTAPINYIAIQMTSSASAG